MTKTPYNDEIALAEYISLYARHFMSDLEVRNLRLCGEIYRIEGCQQDDVEEIRERANEAARVFWNREFDDELKSALAMGYQKYRQQLHVRFLMEAKEGKIPINRCPKCTCVVRTPFAKQCRWCGNQWRVDN